jgi:hypothetical protein
MGLSLSNGLTVGRQALFGGGKWKPVWLIRDEFTTDRLAGAVNGTAAEPGPGTRLVVDTGATMTITGGRLQSTGLATSLRDPGARYGLFSRRAGLMMSALMFPVAATRNRAGWSFNDIATDTARGNLVRSINLRCDIFIDNTTLAVFDDLTSGAEYRWAVSLRANGAYYLLRTGGQWSVLWVDGSRVDATIYPTLSIDNAANINVYDSARVCDLPAPFNTDFGLATDRRAGARSAGDTFSHIADSLIEFTVTTRPTAGSVDFRFREQDANNYWQVTIDSTGAITLNEVVAGVATARGTAAAVVSSGHRVVVIADGETIRGYSNMVLRWTYSSAANFKTATAGRLSDLGTGGAVSDIVAWPRRLTGTAKKILDKVVA